MNCKPFALAALFLLTCSDLLAQAGSGVYVGGHIRRERPKTVTKLKESGFTYVILFNVSVETDGTLTTDGETICKNGQYVFGNEQPYYIEDVKALKTTYGIPESRISYDSKGARVQPFAENDKNRVSICIAE